MNYNIGEVPQGWKRGDRLRVSPASPPPSPTLGSIANVELPSIGDRVCHPNDVGLLTFTHEMGDKVRAWLDWWDSESRGEG